MLTEEIKNYEEEADGDLDEAVEPDGATGLDDSDEEEEKEEKEEEEK